MCREINVFSKDNRTRTLVFKTFFNFEVQFLLHQSYSYKLCVYDAIKNKFDGRNLLNFVQLFAICCYINLYSNIVYNKRKCMTKGSTFKPRTRSEPKGSLRRRAVHKKTFNTTTAGERQRNSEMNPAKERATPWWKENQALSSGWFSEPQAGSCLAFRMV